MTEEFTDTFVREIERSYHLEYKIEEVWLPTEYQRTDLLSALASYGYDEKAIKAITDIVTVTGTMSAKSERDSTQQGAQIVLVNVKEKGRWKLASLGGYVPLHD